MWLYDNYCGGEAGKKNYPLEEFLAVTDDNISTTDKNNPSKGVEFNFNIWFDSLDKLQYSKGNYGTQSTIEFDLRMTSRWKLMGTQFHKVWE